MERIRLLDGGDEAFPRMLEAIRGAPRCSGSRWRPAWAGMQDLHANGGKP